MTDNPLRNEIAQKKPYSRPRLRTIDLVPEQTLGISCKDFEGQLVPGELDAYCGYPGSICYADGS